MLEGYLTGWKVTTIAQVASLIINLLFIVVLGVSYYFLFRSSKEQIKEISFEFSSPIESSHGTVISDSPYFKGCACRRSLPSL